MYVINISWFANNVRVFNGNRTYTCPMEERDDDFYFKFKNQWHSVSKYADERLDAEIKSHKYGLYKRREFISQAEFERICLHVLSQYSDITDYRFEEPGVLHVHYPSHSRRSINGASLYFGVNGYITYLGWQYRSDNNKGRIIGERICGMIQSALYD